MFHSTKRLNPTLRQVTRRRGRIAFFMTLGVSICLGLHPIRAILTQAAAPDADDVASGRVAAQRQQSTSNLKQIMIAMHNYHDTLKSFPPAFMSQEGKPTLSWRVALLPYLEEPDGNRVYTELHLDEPWDSEHNKPLAATMPKVYQSPASKWNDGRTVYLTPRGPATAFPGEKGVAIRRISDGTSNTIAVLEVDDKFAVPWTKPDDWTLDPAHPKVGLGDQFGDGFNAAFLDGSVHFLTNRIDGRVLNALFTIAGGEVVTLPN